MRNKLLRSISTVSVLTCSLGGYANEYPLEFADFFEQRSEQVDVVIEGLSRSESLLADVSYDAFQLPAASHEVLSAFLVEQGLTREAALSIISQLERGIEANPGCARALSSCIPEDVPGVAEFVFDYDAKLLRIFISSEMFERPSGEREYYDPITAKGALINWSNLYAYANDDTHNLNLTNETLLGLPMGYLSVNTQYKHSNSEHDFDVNRAIYSHEFNDLRVLAGYQNANSVRLNSTDFLNNGTDYSGVSVALGRSTNLLKGALGAQQRLYFFAPQSGQLEVYQGERLLLTKVVDSGEQSIGYDELPVGTYNVTLHLKQGSSLVFEEQRQVVNSSNFSLPVGDWDYRFELGRLDDEDVGYAGEALPSVESRDYIRTLFSYRPMERWLMGSGVVSNGQDAQWLLGSRLAFTNKISAQYVAGVFDDSSLYQFGSLDVSPFSFSVRQFEHDNLYRPSELGRLLYGADNITEYSVGTSGSVLGGHAFGNYFRHDIEGRQYQHSSDNVSLTWTRPLWNGDFSVNASYGKINTGQERYSAGISWGRRFGDSYSGRVGTRISDNDQVYGYADASYTHSGDRWKGVAQVGVKDYNTSRLVSEGSLSLSGDTDAVRYDSYGYVSSNGGRSISGSISGSQMVSSAGSAVTSGRGQAYVEFSPEWVGDQKAPSDAEVNYSVMRNNKHWNEKFVPVGQSKLVNLPVYSEVGFALDTESKNIDSKMSKESFFVMPGTYYRLNSDIVPLISQIFILNDMNGDVVKHARCLGDGCKGVEALSDDGVFRVNYRPNEPFKLISEKRLCVYNPELIGGRAVQAYCLPGLDDMDGQLVRQDDAPVVAQVSGSEPLVYIGKYESSDEINHILTRLDEVGLVSKYIEVGATRYVYVQYQSTYSIAQRTLLESLDAYVILDTIDTKQLFTSRFDHEENS